MSRIKVGIIGVGGIATGAHIPGYKAVSEAELYAVADINYERAKDVAKQLGIPASRTFEDYNDMVALDALEAVSVCTPNNFHAPASIAALKAGKHVLCEKPMAGNGKDAFAMWEASIKSGKILQIGVNSRFGARAQVLKSLIESGELGEIYFARCVAMRRRGIPGWGVFIRKDMNAGGALYDIGVHILDRTVWLMGAPIPVSASAMTCTKFGKREGIVNPWGEWDISKFDVDDFAAGFVKFKNGAGLILETAWASNIEGVGPSYILGTEGGCHVDGNVIYKQKHGSLVNVTYEIPGEREGTHTIEIRRFLEAIREGKPSPIPAEEVYRVQLIMDAMYKSSETGQEATIEYKPPTGYEPTSG